MNFFLKVARGAKTYRVIIGSFVFVTIYTSVMVYAANGPFAPGATLNPGCSPSVSACKVDVPTGVTIGDPVTGGAADQVLYEDNNQNVFGDTNFTRDSVTNNTIIARTLTQGGKTGFISSSNSSFAGTDMTGSVYNDTNAGIQNIQGVGNFTNAGLTANMTLNLATDGHGNLAIAGQGKDPVLGFENVLQANNTNTVIKFSSSTVPFQLHEEVTSTSGGHGYVTVPSNTSIELGNVTGTFNIGDQITGVTSGAVATIVTVGSTQVNAAIGLDNTAALLSYRGTSGTTRALFINENGVGYTPSATTQLYLPQNIGTSGQVMTTDGVGQLSFATVASLLYGTQNEIPYFNATTGALTADSNFTRAASGATTIGDTSGTLSNTFALGLSSITASAFDSSTGATGSLVASATQSGLDWNNGTVHNSINATTNGLSITSNNGTTDTTWQWPTADGTTGQALITNNNGTLGWSSVVSAINGVSGAATITAGPGISVTPSGNNIEIDNTSTATIGGSLSAGQIAFGSASNTISGSNYLKWDNTNDTLSLQAGASSFSLGGSTGAMTMRLQGGLVFQGLAVSGSAATITAPQVYTGGSYTVTLPVGQGIAGSTFINDGYGRLTWAIPTAAAGGNDGDLQYNNSGLVTGTDSLNWVDGTGTMTISGNGGLYVTNPSSGTNNFHFFDTNQVAEADFDVGTSRKALFGYDSIAGRATFYDDPYTGGVYIYGSTPLNGGIALGQQPLSYSGNALYIEQQNNQIYTGTYTSGGNTYPIKLGIGTTPTYDLSLNDPNSTGIVAQFTNQSGSCTIDPTASSVACSSDERLKKNITDLNSDQILAQVLQLQGVTFNWNAETDTTSPHIGFIAQQVQQIFPQFVVTDAKGMLGVSYGSFAPVLVEAIKALNIQIKPLSDMLAAENQTSLIGALQAWLGNAGNGITTLFAGTIHSQETDTNNLCVVDQTGAKTCITKSQLDQIIQSQSTSSSPVNNTGGAETNGSGSSSGTTATTSTGTTGTTSGTNSSGGSSTTTSGTDGTSGSSTTTTNTSSSSDTGTTTTSPDTTGTDTTTGSTPPPSTTTTSGTDGTSGSLTTTGSSGTGTTSTGSSTTTSGTDGTSGSLTTTGSSGTGTTSTGSSTTTSGTDGTSGSSTTTTNTSSSSDTGTGTDATSTASTGTSGGTSSSTTASGSTPDTSGTGATTTTGTTGQ